MKDTLEIIERLRHFKLSSTSRAPCSVVLSGKLLASPRRASKRPPRSPHCRQYLRKTRTSRSGRRATGRRRMRDRCSSLFSWSEFIHVPKKEDTISPPLWYVCVYSNLVSCPPLLSLPPLFPPYASPPGLISGFSRGERIPRTRRTTSSTRVGGSTSIRSSTDSAGNPVGRMACSLSTNGVRESPLGRRASTMKP